MKKLLIAAFLLALAFEGKASHATGGEITYEYIGDSTGIPYHYRIVLTLFRRNESGSTTLGSSDQVSIQSSCFGTQSLTLTRITPPNGMAAGDGGIILTPGINCTAPNSPGAVNVSKHIYKSATLLPGKCADFKFSYSLCCRNTVISNIINPSSYDIYIEARLNNTKGPNSSPSYSLPSLRKVCLGQQVISHFGGIEKDGDSLNYTMANPLDAANILLPYSTGYSLSQPITSSTGISFDNASGTLFFTPSQVENDLILIMCDEYRYDSTLTLWYRVGHTQRDAMLNIVGSCIADSTNWVSEFMDSLSAPNELVCGDSIIQLNTNKLFFQSSLAKDGSDFALLNSRNTLIPIVGVGATLQNQSQLLTNSFTLRLNEPIAYNDTLTLITRIGNDLNTLVSGCGEELPAGDSVSFVVTSCQTTIGLSEPQRSKNLHLYPNPVDKSITVKVVDSENAATLSIYSLEGKAIAHYDFSGHKDLNLEFLPKGMYFIKVTSASWTHTAKFEKL